METFVELFNRHSRQLTTLASVLLVVAMSISVAQSVLFFIENLDDEQITATPVKAPRSLGTSRSAVDISTLNLFGVVQRSDAPRVVDAPQTKLNLELQGVFTAEDPEESTAIVAERNKSGQLYTIGERLPGNAILEAVFNDHILIRRGSRVEKLMFSDAALRQQFTPGSLNDASVPSSAATSSRLEDIRERIAERRRQARIARDEDEQDDVDRPASSIRDQLTQYRQRMAADPTGAISEVGLAPVELGETNGYRVAGNVPDQILRQTGLQKGDVILSVNGTPVGNAANDQSLIDSAIAAGRVRVEVQRSDRKFFVTVPIPD
jgi:general secretion pathway protein C